jgi:hypothetical protein
MLQLEVKATHRAKHDFLELQIFVYNPDEDKFQPQRIVTGVATLYRTLGVDERQTLGTATFDRREGTADGSVRVFFLHPLVLNELTYEVRVDIEGSLTLTKQGTFQIQPPPTPDTQELPEQPLPVSPRSTTR